MDPSIRFTAKRILFPAIISALMVIVLTLFPLSAPAQEDSCRETGITIGNQTMLDVWVTRDGGPCTLWNHGHLLVVKSKESLKIYRDMTCKTEYCPTNPTYDVYKSLDANQNCRVRILPDCALSDM